MVIRVILAVMLAAMLAPARAAEPRLTLSLGQVSGAGWQAEGVRLVVSSAEVGKYRLHADIDRVQTPLGQWRGVAVGCDDLRLAHGAYQCDQLVVRAVDLEGVQSLSGRLRYRDGGDWSLSVGDFRHAGGGWSLDAATDGTPGGWRAAVKGRGVSVAALLARWLPKGLPTWQWSGTLDASLVLTGRDQAPRTANLQATLRKGRWASPDGLQAAEELGLQLTLRADYGGSQWRGSLIARSTAGQIYSDPMFVALDQHPISIETRWDWREGASRLVAHQLAGGLGKLVRLSGSRLSVPFEHPEAISGDVRVELPDLAAAYPVLLQPLGYGGPLGALKLAGGLSGALVLSNGRPAMAALRLHDVHLDDDRGRFGVAGLRGELNWSTRSDVQPSALSWDSSHVYRVDIGRAETRFRLFQGTAELLRPLQLPVLDGRLTVPHFTATGLGEGAASWRSALQADELSLPRLTQALGWPALSGALSVQVPDVHYADGTLAFDGELVAQAFDGTVRVSGLALRDPLGPAPVFTAEARLQGLDLQRVTRAFNFGQITGRLDGRVTGLELVGWQPVAFQAILETPARDDLPHRISQRAVDNLTALGNGGAAALSGTFLRLFESFGYDRLELRVNLKGQRALLDGMPHANGGYYLVKGAGLPRIDVIGRNREVAWRDLVERLRRVSFQDVQVR